MTERDRRRAAADLVASVRARLVMAERQELQPHLEVPVVVADPRPPEPEPANQRAVVIDLS